MKKLDPNVFILRSRRQMAFFIAFVAAVVAVLAMLLERRFDRTIYDERKEMLSMVVHSAARNFVQEIESDWELYNLSYSLVADCALNASSVEDCINSVNNRHDFGTDYYFLVDDNGNYYSSDGVTGKLADFDNYLNTSPDRMEFFATLPHLNHRKNFMIYRGRFDEAMRMNTSSGEKTITFFAYAQNLDHIKNAIKGMVKKPCNIFVSDSDGLLMYEEYGLTKVIDGNNIYKKFHKCRLPFGEDPAEMEKCCHEGQNLVCLLKIKGKEYFFCTSPLGISDWSLSLLLLPEEMDDNISREVLLLILLMISIIIIVGIAMAYGTYCGRVVIQEERQMESEKLMTAIEDASKAKTVFLSNMSHDIRTPINGIMGITAIAKSALNDPAKISDCLGKIETASSHLLSLINDVLDMSRIESGKTTITTAPADIKEVCSTCAGIVQGQIAERDLKFSLEMSVDHPKVYADVTHLNRVFINILGNAVKFTRDGGRILFRCHETECTDSDVTIVFEFKDTGIGMSKKFLGKIFDAFSQEENRERTKYTGTGLGMSITKQLVELMGGEIEVRSEINKGSEFYVTIKFRRDLEACECETQTQTQTETSSDISGVRILLVEDNELNMEIAETLLTSGGAIVDKAWDGLEAVDRFSSKDSGTYDAILMDVMMPRMNGLDATRTIRALNREDAATIPIIAMTANAFDDDIRATREAGMNAHLSKPIEIDMVMKTIASFVNKER